MSILCDQCNQMSGVAIKDGGTIFCVECLHFIKTKNKCNGYCSVRCMKCTKNIEELRKITNLLKQQQYKTYL